MKLLNYLTRNPKDAPYSATYKFAGVDFGNGDSEVQIPAPEGRVGYITEVVIHDVTEAFNSVTTSARVEIGIASGDTDYHLVSDDLSDLAIGASERLTMRPGINPTTLGNETVGVNCIAPTGGVPAGIGAVSVTILWF